MVTSCKSIVEMRSPWSVSPPAILTAREPTILIIEKEFESHAYSDYKPIDI